MSKGSMQRKVVPQSRPYLVDLLTWKANNLKPIPIKLSGWVYSLEIFWQSQLLTSCYMLKIFRAKYGQSRDGNPGLTKDKPITLYGSPFSRTANSIIGFSQNDSIMSCPLVPLKQPRGHTTITVNSRRQLNIMITAPRGHFDIIKITSANHVVFLDSENVTERHMFWLAVPQTP